jgi:hypothetical protein
MTMRAVLEQWGNRLNMPKRHFNIFCAVSALWIAGCLLLFIPAVRLLIIQFGESFIVHRPLTHVKWHERFIAWSIYGLIVYGAFFLMFMHRAFCAGENAGKKLYMFVIAAALFFVFCIMFRANWVFSDDHQFITSTAINKYLPFTIFPAGGRFFPFGLSLYNPVLFVFRLFGINSGLPAGAHFGVVAFLYVFSAACLYRLFRETKPPKDNNGTAAAAVFFACTFPLLFPPFISVFLRLIYPETQLAALFSLFMLVYYKARETNKKRYFIAALLSAVYASYCKEPVFGVFVIIALTNHVFRYKAESKREKILYWLLVLNAAVFLVLYYVLARQHTVSAYNTGRVAEKGFDFVRSVFAGNPVPGIMFLSGFIRLFFVVVRNDKEHLYYDSLLFAGMGYTAAYMLLHLNGGYYFLPSVVLSLPSLVYWIRYFFQKRPGLALLLCGGLMALYAFNLRTETGAVQGYWRNRRDFMPYIEELYAEYRAGKRFVWYESDNTLTDNTFYKAVRAWRKHVENAFLNYRNKSLGNKFFTTARRDTLELDSGTLFFYPVDNDQGQPVPEELAAALNEWNFELYRDWYGVLIYRRR